MSTSVCEFFLLQFKWSKTIPKHVDQHGRQSTDHGWGQIDSPGTSLGQATRALKACSSWKAPFRRILSEAEHFWYGELWGESTNDKKSSAKKLDEIPEIQRLFCTGNVEHWAFDVRACFNLETKPPVTGWG